MGFEHFILLMLAGNLSIILGKSILLENERVEIHTENYLIYKFFPVLTNHLHIKVKVKSNAHIALTTTRSTNKPIYEVFIGGWENKMSTIRKNRNIPDLVQIQTINILDENRYKGFWIHWSREAISVGIEGNYNPFMKWEDQELFNVLFFGVSIGKGSIGHWIIHSTPPIGNENWRKARTVYDFTVKSICGEEVPLNIYRGHVLVIVNVASTYKFSNKHYPELSELQRRYEKRGLRILIFPSNQFLMESGSNVEIKEFAQNFNKNFQLFEKVYVNGDGALPLYKFLKRKQSGIITQYFTNLLHWLNAVLLRSYRKLLPPSTYNQSKISKLGENVNKSFKEKVAGISSGIKWNFTKFIINRHGDPVYRAAADIRPLDSRFLDILEKCLNEEVEV